MISSRKFLRRLAFVSGGAIIAALAFGPLIGNAIGNATGHGTSAKLTALGLKFDGASKCAGGSCHGKGNTDPVPPKERGSENDIWSGFDAHAQAYNTLTNDESKAIATKMGIGEATAAKECLGCHASDAPANLQGEGFSLEEGNSCTSCHGPSEKYLTPHADGKWVPAQRAALKSDQTEAGHEALLKATGLYDTRPIVARATLCASCHLSIDSKMVAAGHPQPKFELHHFTEQNPKTGEPWKHWTTDKGGATIAHTWLAGQAACAHDALVQLAGRAEAKESAESIAAAYDQAVAHASLFAAAAKAVGAGDLSAAVAGVTAAKGDPAKLGAASTAAAKAIMGTYDKLYTWKADAASAKAMLAAVAGWKSAVADAGTDGQLQVYYGLQALAEASGATRDDAKSATEALKLEGDAKADPAKFEAALTEAAGKLPK